MAIDYIQHYLEIRPLISIDECYNGIQKEIEARKARRNQALAKIDQVTEEFQAWKKEKRITRIKARLLEIEEEKKLLEQTLQRLDKGKQRAIATPELPEEKKIIAPQNEALETESFHQCEDQKPEDEPGPQNKEGELTDDEWVDKLNEMDYRIIQKIEGIVPPFPVLELMYERLKGPRISENSEWIMERALKDPNNKWATHIENYSRIAPYQPTAQDREWLEALEERVIEVEMRQVRWYEKHFNWQKRPYGWMDVAYNKIKEEEAEKKKKEEKGKKVTFAEVVKKDLPKEESAADIPEENKWEISYDESIEPVAESSSMAQSQPPPPERKLLAVNDHIKKYPRLKIKDVPRMECRCEPLKLITAFHEHKAVFTSTMRMPFHCCLCKRPGHTGVIAFGNENYYQWCRACEKSETFDITQTSWYGKPCRCCLTPLTQRENMGWNTDVCSKACKYAYLAVHYSNDFTHIPTLIKKYKFSRNCRELYLDVAVQAERLYRRLYPNEQLNYHTAKYHNQLSWMEMAREFAEEINAYSPSMPSTIDALDSDEAIALRRSFNDYENNLMERFPRMVDLQQDERLGGNMKLCEECLLPFTLDELKKKDGRWLCIETEHNRDPCELGLPAQGTNTQTQSQPRRILSRPPNDQDIGPWSAFLQ